MAETGKVRWGIIGATARIAGGRLIPAILQSEHAELAAVASRTLANAQEIAAKAGPGVQAYGDYDSLIADAAVEVVYIPLPNNLHAGWAVEAMNNGKHVLCEQPLALNAAEAAEMALTARENGVLLSEAFMYRYHPLQQAVAAQMLRGAVGEAHLVRASFSFVQTDPTDYRRNPGMGGGALLDIGCYCVHIARHAFGREPVAVSAKSVYDAQTGVDVTTTAQMEFEGGRIALIDCSFAVTFRAAYEIVGTHGCIEVPKFFVTPDEATEYRVAPEGGEPQSHRVPPSDMYQAEVDAISRRVRGQEAPLLPAEDGLNNMRAIDAIAASARSGERVAVAAAG